MLKATQFTYAGRSFEIRAEAIDNKIVVALFENGKRASPVTFSVEIETVFNAKISGFPLNLVDGLMDLMESDTTAGRLVLYQEVTKTK